MWIIVILGNFLITPLIQHPQAAQHTVETNMAIRKHKGGDEFPEYKWEERMKVKKKEKKK